MPGEQFQSAATNQMIYFHKLGDEQTADALIYRRPDNPDWSFGITPTDDGKYLVLGINRSTDPQNQVLVRETSASADAKWTEPPSATSKTSSRSSAATARSSISSPTSPPRPSGSSRWTSPSRAARTLPRSSPTEARIDSASILAGRLIVQSLIDVLPHVRLFDLQGKPLGEVKLPGLGTVAGFGGHQDNTETFYIFTSYNTPTAVYRYDVPANKSELVRLPEVKFNPEDFVVEQVFYKSKDGTRVPMMIAHRKDMPIDQPQPTLLYGYGGYSITISPAFSADYIAWMELGGVVAVANLRGGGEYGEEWHRPARTSKTKRLRRLYRRGRMVHRRTLHHPRPTRNHGRQQRRALVGAVMVQRPGLFGACIPMPSA